MTFRDDDLSIFATRGAPALPRPEIEGRVGREGAGIWYAAYGAGPPVVLLHGGLGHSGNWGRQLPALLAAGRRVIVIDSRGHGRSTRDARPYTYELMAADVAAVLDALAIRRAAFVGWSDGACIAMVLALRAPERVERVFFFGCNMDPSGTKPFVATPVIDRAFDRHARDYAALSATPDDFKVFVEAVSHMMATEPNYTAADLAQLGAIVTIALSDGDEFITREHADYLAAAIPNAELVILPGVTHFAPLQRPEVFNAAVAAFLAREPV